MKATNNGTICSYEDFRQEAASPPKTGQFQRIEIEHALDRLTWQGDFWSLDLIRGITNTLAGDTREAFALYCLLHGIRRLSADKLEKLGIVVRSMAE